MIQTSFFVGLFVLSISTLLLTFSFTLAQSFSPLFLNESLALQDGGSLYSGSQNEGLEDQQGPVVGVSSVQCPPNQHNVGSTIQCEWDNCGSATPPMYRNTQTGRCVTDCSEVGQFWVKQGNICVLSEVSNTTSTQSPSVC